MTLSIITPTLGNKKNLNRLFRSLQKQDTAENIEVILSTTEPNSKELLEGLETLPNNFSIHTLSVHRSGIALARNRGLRAAQGEYVFFLDDDCSLPRSTYLSEALSKLRSNPQNAWAGSYLIADDSLEFPSSFYNYMSTLWLKSFFKDEHPLMVLGGCALFHRETLIASGAIFEENEDKAAEEHAFSRKVIEHKILISYADELSVHHNPGCNLKTLIQKSWNHGHALGTYTKTPHQRRWHSYWKQAQRQPLQNLRFSPLLVLFLGVGRAAYFYRKSSEIVKSTHKPFLKRS